MRLAKKSKSHLRPLLKAADFQSLRLFFQDLVHFLEAAARPPYLKYYVGRHFSRMLAAALLLHTTMNIYFLVLSESDTL